MIIADPRPFEQHNHTSTAILSNTPPQHPPHSSTSMTEKEEVISTMRPDTTSTSSNNNNNHHDDDSSDDEERDETTSKTAMNGSANKHTSKKEEDDPAVNNNDEDNSKRNNKSLKKEKSSKKNSTKKSSSSKNVWKEKAADNPWASAPSSGGVAWGSAPQQNDDSSDDEEGADQLASLRGHGNNNNHKQDLNSSTASLNFSVVESLIPPKPKAVSEQTVMSPLVETHVAVRVMKGEIHNVLTAMRSSEQSYISAQRFMEELNQDHHPLVGQFQELHAALSDWDLQMAAQSLYKRDASSMDIPDGMLYLPPFCTAVSTREINAPVTGACLTALHKFLLYGLVHPAADAKQGMTLIARALLHCTFEETQQQQGGADRRSRFARQLKNEGSNASTKSMSSRFLQGSSTVSDNMSVVSGDGQSTIATRSTLLSRQKSQNSAAAAAAAVNLAGSHPYYHPTRVSDEQVVLKLLDLAAMVVRCSFLGQGGACLITSDLVAGLLDTCLHVSHIAKSASPLLKSAAQDSLAQIVLQVFCKHPQQLKSASQSGAKSTASNNNAIKAREQVLSKLASLLNPTNHKQLDPEHRSSMDPDDMDNDKDGTGTTGKTRKTNKQQQQEADHHNHSHSSAASITHPSAAMAQVVCSSLDAVNIALEHLRGDQLSEQEVLILQNDLCKYLLQWSTTSDLHILSLTLRVIFNLFQSIQNHLKVPLEVFLTSVHLRILNSFSSNYEEREVVLESILEFCQEPALMQDIYRNYDCDIACTNLYEMIVKSLGKAALPNNYVAPTPADKITPAAAVKKELEDKFEHDNNEDNSKHEEADPAAPQEVPSKTPATPAKKSMFGSGAAAAATTPAAPGVAPITQLNKLALEGLLAILNSIARRVHADRSPFLQNLSASKSHGMSISMSPGEGDMMDSMAFGASQAELHAKGMSEDDLQQRRALKNALVQVAEVFNEDPFGPGWLDMAVNLDAIDRADNAKAVAHLLYTASGLDKAQVGIYLSKGPDEKYPFLVAVRHEFVGMYDFSSMNFCGALRSFLSKFRLPGEAQCIDRFMEAFSNEYYKQQTSKASGNSGIFADSDAVYVLSFSTIMLNTDLHNPGIKDENRMTIEQFIKNNRGINGGNDLPPEYLTELYNEIKSNQIQVQRQVGDFIKKQEGDADFKTAWDSILTKHREVATAMFTTAGDARRNIFRAGLFDRQMFAPLLEQCLIALPAVFTQSWDDIIVFKALRGMKQLCMIANHFEMPEIVNQVLQFLLQQGKEYVRLCIIQDFNPSFNSFAKSTSNRSLGGGSDTDGDNDDTIYDDEDMDPTSDQIPYSLLSSGKAYSELDYSGAAFHRGLLALDTGFLLVRRYAREIHGEAWPLFLECLCCMRDAHALPAGLADLDDFADAQGQVLPLSPYARISQKKLDQFYVSKATEHDPRFARGSKEAHVPQGLEQKSWYERLWGPKSLSGITDPVPGGGADLGEERRAQLRSNPDQLRQMGEPTRAVLAVAEQANVEKIVQMGSTKLPVASTTVRQLLDVVDAYPYSEDPVAEQHAVFSLELAARALLSNRETAAEVFPTFLAKFESILQQVPQEGESGHVACPFVIERIVVTILRCSIHLYDMEDLRPNLRVSLHLLVMSLPRLFIRDIADRMACGLAIILRASFPFFESHNEWTFMGDTLDTLANYASARVFVFDGIASTVECAMPQEDPGQEQDDANRFPLTKEGSGALSKILIRFVLGFYQGDFSLSVPASVCLEKLYHHMNGLLLEDMIAAAKKRGETIDLTDKDRKVPNKDYWQNVAVALYSVCRSPDPKVSRHGYEICQRVILRTPLREVPADKWLAVLYLMVNKQPPTAADLSRSNTFVLLGNMLMRVLPYLSKRQRPPSAEGEEESSVALDPNQVDGEDLADLVRLTASLAGENLRHGRRGTISPLFEKTLQTLTYLSNHMQTDDWKGDKEFGLFASETLLAELEKVGAAGASLQNQLAITGPEDHAKEDEKSDGEEEDEEGEKEENDEEEDDDDDDA